MKLYTPDGSEIVSILLKDGSASDFEFNASTQHGETVVMYTLPKGKTSEVATEGGERILIDANGKRWFASDVEYHNAGSFNNH